jgi:hypothetical protein
MAYVHAHVNKAMDRHVYPITVCLTFNGYISAFVCSAEAGADVIKSQFPLIFLKKTEKHSFLAKAIVLSFVAFLIISVSI